jgi:hypothetical protein
MPLPETRKEVADGKPKRNRNAGHGDSKRTEDKADE